MAEQKPAAWQDPEARIRFADEGVWPRFLDGETGSWIRKPPFATIEEALERASRERAGELHRIRLFSDHGPSWPLWDVDAGYTAEPEYYGLSLALATELLHWADIWLSVANEENVLGNPHSHLPLTPQWFDWGAILAVRLAEEVWHIGDVFPWFWMNSPYWEPRIPDPPKR